MALSRPVTAAGILVAAIDLGTTFSGYAFSYNRNPTDIKINKNWGSEVNCETYKTPTAVLTGPHGEFCAFGYAAEKQYADKRGQNGYQLFQRFKLVLCEEKVSDNIYYSLCILWQ